MNIVIINCFDTWEHRVSLLYQVMTEAGNKVCVLCSDYCHIEKKRRTEKKKNYKFFTAIPYKKNISAARIYSHLKLGSDIFSFAERRAGKIDLLWVLAPPNYFIYHAARMKQQHSHLRLIIDFIDLWPETMPWKHAKKLPVFNLWKNLRDEALKYADYAVMECCLFKKVLGEAVAGMKTETLYLAREDKGYKPELHLPADKLALCYLGSINNIIDISCIGEIVKNCGKCQKVVLHIIGDGEKRDELIRTACNAGAEVVYHGKIYDRKKKQFIFDSCHFGLNIMKASVCVGLTMKSVDYFEFGLPIINNIYGDTWHAVKMYGAGVNWEKGMTVNIDSSISMRNNARDFFVQNLTMGIFRDKVQKVIQYAEGLRNG